MISGLIPRDGRYSTRKVIPVDLQPHYGRREIVRALGTSDPAAAKRAHLDMLRAFETEFDAARMELNAQAEITPSEEARPLADISPTALALVKIDSLRDDRDRAAKEGELAMFMRAQRDALTMVQAMLDGEVEPTQDYRELEGLRNALRAFLTGDNSFAIAAARKARTAVDEAQTKPAAPGGNGSIVKRSSGRRRSAIYTPGRKPSDMTEPGVSLQDAVQVQQERAEERCVPPQPGRHVLRNQVTFIRIENADLEPEPLATAPDIQFPAVVAAVSRTIYSVIQAFQGHLQGFSDVVSPLHVRDVAAASGIVVWKSGLEANLGAHQRSSSLSPMEYRADPAPAPRPVTRALSGAGLPYQSWPAIPCLLRPRSLPLHRSPRTLVP